MNSRVKLSVVLAVGVTGLLIAAMLLYQQPDVYAQTYSDSTSQELSVKIRFREGPGPMHFRGGGRGPFGNLTVSAEEIQLAGRLVELDRGYMAIDTGAERITVKTPMVLIVGDQPVTLLRLAFEDRLNAGDEVQLTVHRVTVTRPDGTERSFYVLKELRDLTTGLEASVPYPRLGPSTGRATAANA
ncbi:MAG: hypothetical protein RMJ28_06895 [Nitrososphaerota archaeon]|nr:hypothetical protein [Candidatus Calditenuaceae archaeon]MDW8073940.1 hypothetical protein [Nitrososphaerota archaeon]